jgi:hypothetical protein
MLAGKYISNDGYVLFGQNASQVQARFNTATAVYAAPSVGVADYALQYTDPAIPRSGVYSGFAGDSGGSAVADLSNAQIFTLGSVSIWVAQGCVIGPCIFWRGAAAQAVIANRATLLPAWWSS